VLGRNYIKMSQAPAAAQSNTNQNKGGQKSNNAPANKSGAQSQGSKPAAKPQQPQGQAQSASKPQSQAQSASKPTQSSGQSKPAQKSGAPKTQVAKTQGQGTKPAAKPQAKPQQAKPQGSKAAAKPQAAGTVAKTQKRKKKRVIKSVQTFGKKKTAIAVAYTREGSGLIKINGSPIELVEPQILRYKVFEPVLLVGHARFAKIDIRIRVQGGGHVSQIYAIRQALAKAVVAYYQKFVDENEKQKIKDILMDYDRSLLAIDPRRCEPKKFGGRGARARFQKSYR